MEFLHALIAQMASTTVELSECAQAAYGGTLRKYHGFLVRGIFALAVRAVPYRADFLRLLGGDGVGGAADARVLEQSRTNMDHLGRHLAVLGAYCRRVGIDSDATV